jgi:hypothetical protein
MQRPLIFHLELIEKLTIWQIQMLRILWHSFWLLWTFLSFLCAIKMMRFATILELGIVMGVLIH